MAIRSCIYIYAKSEGRVKSTAVEDPDLFLRHSEKYELSLAIISQIQLTVAHKRQSGTRRVHIVVF